MTSDGQAGADWRPVASLPAIQARAQMLTRIRAFFADAGVMEVETPLLSWCGATDPALESFSLSADAGSSPSCLSPPTAASASVPAPCASSLPFTSPSPKQAARRLYLQTSPEFHMKRLLAQGTGPIYQISRVFRAGERGRLHHPEFTLLEWYRPGWDPQRLMEEVAGLVRLVLQRPTLAAERLAYRDLFSDLLGLDPFRAEVPALRDAAMRLAVPDAGRLELDRDGWLDLLLVHQLEPRLGKGRLSFLCDYPPSQAALARIRPAKGDEPAVAERFELYFEGIELANGFHELIDADEQARRFADDLSERRRLGQPEVPPDQRLVAALKAGMPATSGVALGLDRLLMLGLGAHHIDGVLTFPIERA